MMKTIQLILVICLWSVNLSFASAIHVPVPQRVATMDVALPERTAVPLLTPETAKPRLNLEKIEIRQEKPSKDIEPYTVVSFVAGLSSMFIPLFTLASSMVALSFLLAGLLGLTAITCGIIGLIKIGKYKEKLKGRAFAIFGIIFGTLSLLLWTANALSMLALE